MTTFRHARGLPGTTPVLRTAGLVQVQMHLPAVIDKSLILQVSGPNGAGKTSSIDFALQYAAEDHGIKWCELRVTDNARGKATMQELCDKLGVGVPRRATERVLIDRAIETLASEPWVVWLDEMENATSHILRVVRHVFDSPELLGSAALIISGDQRLTKHLRRREPALVSRIGRQVRLQRIDDADAPALMADYHPVYANSNRAVLTRINGRVRGEFRQWARLTEVVESTRQALDPVPQAMTRPLMNAVSPQMGWR